MMKNLLLKNLIVTFVTGVAILLTPKTSVAQVNPRFLTEVAESCQKDVFSSEYHQQMGYKGGVDPNYSGADSYLSNCIQGRYFYLQVISKLPWLVSSGEMLLGYPGQVAVSQMAYKETTNLLDCLASQDNSSQECTKTNFRGLYNDRYNGRWRAFGENGYNNFYINHSFYAYMCPSCYLAYNNNPSRKRMIGAFIEWFMKLESSQKKELMSILGDEQTHRNNRNNMIQEAHKAWQEYQIIRQRLTEEEKERRIRELFE